MKNKSIKINLILNTIRTFITIVFPLIVFPYASRILLASNIGKIQFAVSIVSYFSLLASLGISVYAIREGAALRENKKKLEEFCNEVFSINIIATIISYLLLFIVIFFMNKTVDYKWLIIIQSLTIIFTTLGVDWVNSMLEDYIYITIRTLIIQIFVLICTFLFIKNPADYYSYAFISVLSSVGANIFNFFHVRKQIKIKFTWNLNLKKHIKPVLILFSQTIATTIYNSSDVTMLGFMTNDYTIGIYYVGTKIYTIFKQLVNSTSAVMIPRISSNISKNNKEQINNLLNKLLKIIIILILPLVTGLIILSKEIVYIISGIEYLESQYSLIILSFALLFSAIAYFSSNIILITNHEEKKALIATITASIINFILNFLFILFWQEKGAAMTTVIAEAVVAIITTIHAKKYFKPSGIIKTIITSFIGCILICVYSLIIKIFNFSVISNILIIFGGSLIIYFIVLLIFNKEDIEEYYKGLKKLLKKA